MVIGDWNLVIGHWSMVIEDAVYWCVVWALKNWAVC